MNIYVILLLNWASGRETRQFVQTYEALRLVCEQIIDVVDAFSLDRKYRVRASFYWLRSYQARECPLDIVTLCRSYLNAHYGEIIGLTVNLAVHELEKKNYLESIRLYEVGFSQFQKGVYANSARPVHLLDGYITCLWEAGLTQEYPKRKAVEKCEEVLAKLQELGEFDERFEYHLWSCQASIFSLKGEVCEEEGDLGGAEQRMKQALMFSLKAEKQIRERFGRSDGNLLFVLSLKRNLFTWLGNKKMVLKTWKEMKALRSKHNLRSGGNPTKECAEEEQAIEHFLSALPVHNS